MCVALKTGFIPIRNTIFEILREYLKVSQRNIIDFGGVQNNI